MTINLKVKVSSKSFSKNPVLRQELLAVFPAAEFNDELLDLTEENFADFLGDSIGVIVGLEPINEPILKKCPKLQFASKFGVGLDNVDQQAAEKHSVKIGWTGGLNRRCVAEMTLCFMIGMSRNIFFSANNLLIDNDWSKNGGHNLSNRTVGIIGVGFIGKELIELLKPFDCKILVNDIIDQADYYQTNELIECSKEEIYAKADVITIHTSLDDTTRGFVNADVFKQMKETSFFINCARGGLVVQRDLKYALVNRIIAGAAIDVFEMEPSDDFELINLQHLICTPHTGGASDEAVLAMGRSAISHLFNYFDR